MHCGADTTAKGVFAALSFSSGAIGSLAWSISTAASLLFGITDLRIILALVIVTGGLAGFYHIDGKRRRHADISGRAGAIASRGRRDGLGSCPITQIRRRGEGHVGAERLETALDRRTARALYLPGEVTRHWYPPDRRQRRGSCAGNS
jgi:hypothetical protein